MTTRLTLVGFLSIAVVLSSTASAQQFAWSPSFRGGSVTFAVNRSKALVEANRAASQPELRLTLPGELFEPPVTLQTVTRPQANTDTPLGVLQSDWSAQLADDAAWIADNFATTDQAEVARWLADANLRDANLRVLQREGRARVVGWARLKQTLVAILLYENGRRIPLTLVPEAGHWKRTNKLSADSEFDVIFAATRDGTLTRGGDRR